MLIETDGLLDFSLPAITQALGAPRLVPGTVLLTVASLLVLSQATTNVPAQLPVRVLARKLALDNWVAAAPEGEVGAVAEIGQLKLARITEEHRALEFGASEPPVMLALPAASTATFRVSMQFRVTLYDTVTAPVRVKVLGLGVTMVPAKAGAAPAIMAIAASEAMMRFILLSFPTTSD